MTDAFLITTKLNRKYLVVDHRGNPLHGAIIRLDMPFRPTEQWAARCIHNSRGTYVGEWRSLFIDGTFENVVTFKNGNPKYYLGDYDHGSIRSWGDGLMSVTPVVAWEKADGNWDWRMRQKVA